MVTVNRGAVHLLSLNEFFRLRPAMRNVKENVKESNGKYYMSGHIQIVAEDIVHVIDLYSQVYLNSMTGDE